MSIAQQSKISPSQRIVIALFVCLILLCQSPFAGLHIYSTAWASDPSWSNAFDTPTKKHSPSSRKSGTSSNAWNTVIDNNSYKTKIDNNWKTEKSSDPSEQIQPQTNVHENQPAALALIDTLLTANQPADIPPTLYINNMTKIQYAGAVSMAMEGMRLFYGDMDEKQEALFESRWLPLFRYPSQEIIYYVNQLNPLLLQFLTLRAALNDCIEDFNATQLAVMSCTGIGDAEGVSEAMDSAAIYALAGNGLNARLQLVGKEIIDLGEPPNAAGLMKKARQKHEDAFKEFSQRPIISIFPAKLKAVPGREYTFKIEIADYEKYQRKDKLHLTCEGREKIKNGILIVKKSFHKKIGSTEKFTVQLHQYPGPKILASVTAEITMVKNPGCWTLVECHTYGTAKQAFLTYNVNQQECRIESSCTPPSFTGKSFKFGYLNSWQAPPQRLSPKTELQIPINFTRLHPCAGFTEEKIGKIFDELYNAHGEEKIRLLKEYADYCTCLTNCGSSYAMALSPASITFSCVDNLKLSARIENDPWTTGSLNKSEAKLETGALKTHALLTQTVPNGIQEDHYDKDKPNRIAFHIQAMNRFFYYKDYSSDNSRGISGCRAGVVYVYQWDPTGSQIKPLDIGRQEIAAEPGTPSGVLTKEQKRAEKIIFHKHNIEYFTKNISVLNKQFVTAADPESRNRLTRDLLYAEDARQREIDAITTIKTGEFVRTRTALDALNMKIMADQSRVMESHFHTDKRIRERGPRLIKLAPKAEREKLMKFFKSHVLSEYDSDKMHAGMDALSNKVLGGIEVEIAAHEEDAQYWDENLKMAQYTKTGADYAMMALSFTGAGATYNLFGKARMITASGVYMAYNATTGYINGGWKEAVSGTLAAYNTGTTIINAGMQGYQAGVLQHLEEYAQNPQKVALDEERAGFKGAAWSAGTAAAIACAVKFGMKAYQNRKQTIKNRETLLQLKCDKVKQQYQVRHFKQRTVAAAKKVKTFRQRQMALSEAGQANAPKNEILRLRSELDNAYKDIKTDYFAKKIMKSMAVKARANYDTTSGRAHHKTVHAYNSIDRRFTTQLKTRLSERMNTEGFNQQCYKTFSNSASRGGIGMDVDMGVIEPPRYVTVDGRRTPNPAHATWRRNLTHTVNGVTRRVSPQDLQEAGQRQLERAFEDVYGHRPGEAMLSYTTSYHPEAYRDPRWLGCRQSKTALVYQTDPQWTQQAADVTDFKINTMDIHNPSLGYYGRMQENCRGLVKDFNTKLEPLLARSTNKTAVDHMRELKNVMEQFSNNKIGPVKAEQRLRMMTGNKDGIREVSQSFSLMLQGLKLPVASAR